MGRMPPESAMIPLANFSPVPVRFRTPMMMPAVAQAAVPSPYGPLGPVRETRQQTARA